MKRFVMQLLSDSRYFLFLRFIYYPQYPVHKATCMCKIVSFVLILQQRTDFPHTLRHFLIRQSCVPFADGMSLSSQHDVSSITAAICTSFNLFQEMYSIIEFWKTCNLISQNVYGCKPVCLYDDKHTSTGLRLSEV
jgi:hypothetical protein